MSMGVDMFGKLAAIAAVIGLAYFGYSSWQDSAESAKLSAEAKKRASRLKAKALSAAKAHGAVVDWPARLAQSQRMRLSQVLTAEVHDLWTNGRPILFVGIVSDIARSTSSSVELTVDYGSLNQGHIFT